MDKESRKVVSDAWALPADEVLARLQVSAADGLSQSEATRRFEEYGPNELRIREKRGAFRILIDQLRSTVVLLLAVAAVLSFAFGGTNEGVAIVAVLVINTLIGFTVELRAVRSMDALRALGGVRTRVRRAGRSTMVRGEEVVPGDILVLEGGDTVTADARLVSASRLRANESTFTGESVPVDKTSDALESADRIDQRLNMIFKGTSLSVGSCEAVVVTTGMQTELGHISELTESTGSETTPLEKQLVRVGNKLIVLTIIITVVVVIAGVLAGKPLHLMIETGIALAVATIPEGLPIVSTIALARGLWRMSRRHALINKLSAVETLGATSVLCTDKTGTLTESRMRVAHVVCESNRADLKPNVESEPGALEIPADCRSALELGVLCNRASLAGEDDGSHAVGDPLEIALLLAGLRINLNRAALIDSSPEVGADAFDAVTKLMATFHQRADSVLVAVKGAPEAVIENCTRILELDSEAELDESRRARALGEAETLATQGLRVIAVARRVSTEVPSNPYEGLTLVGLLGLIDPPRLEVREAIESCHSAGIRVLMITGDHPATAGAIAKAVGLGGALEEDAMPVVEQGVCVDGFDQLSAEERERIRSRDLFARVSPEQKLSLIRLHQEAGTVVGMIGDGVNDAPALEQADIGIAMGLRGTEVAREAAEMVLRDDCFSSVVVAVEEGRVIFGNIRKFVVYLLSCNISEVMVLAIAAGVEAPLPILPLQILFLNLVSDIFPALALGVGPGPAGVMNQPPRAPKEGILTASHGRWIAGHGSLLTATVLAVFYLCLGPLALPQERAVTVTFLTLAFAQLWHVFNMRDRKTQVFRNEITRNPFVWGALLLCTALIGMALYVPMLASVLKLERPTLTEWTLVAVFSLIPLVLGQAFEVFRQRRGERGR